MAVTWEARRLRHERAMDRRFIEQQRALAQAIVPLILRAASTPSESGQTLPDTRRSRTELKAAIWNRVLKPYFIGRGDDPFEDTRPRSPFALLVQQGVEGATRIQAERQAALLRQAVRDPVVANWLTAPRASSLREMRIQEQIQEPRFGVLPFDRPPLPAVLGLNMPLFGGDLDFVRGRGAYDPLHTWVDPNGYRLSDRIWRAAISERSRLDELLDYHIGRGTSAVDIAREVETFLIPGRGGRTRRPYGEEGSFAARTLARTEISAAAGRATIAAGTANPFVTGIQWRLSAQHAGRIDECDINAAGGPNNDGIYPPDQVPRYPNHPNEMCSLVPVATGSVPDLIRDLRAQIDASTPFARQVRGLFDPRWMARALWTGELREALLALAPTLVPA